MIARQAKRALAASVVAAAFLAPAVADAATRYVRSSGNDGNAAGGCSTPATACLTIAGAVNAAATVDGDTIDIGPGTFAAPAAAITKTLSFVGNGPGTPGAPADAGTTVIDAGAGPQEGLELLKGGSVSNLRLKGATGGGFSEALVLGTNSPATAKTYTVSNVVATGGLDPTNIPKPALLTTDAGAAGGVVNATVAGYFEGSGIVSGLGPGIVAATGTNVNLTVNDSTLEFNGGNVTPATVLGGAALTLNRTVVPDEMAVEGVLSAGAGSELTISRSDIEARETPVHVQDFGGGAPGDTTIRDSRLLAKPTSGVPEAEQGLLAAISSGAGSFDIDIDGSTLAAVGPNVEAGLAVIVGNSLSTGINVTASNSIFRATDTAPAPDGSARDIRAVANLGMAASANVSADHSSYTSVAQPNFGSVTPAGSGTNISGNPQFTNEAGFDLTLQANSPLIDAGASGVSGPLDLTGNAREQDGNCDGTAQPDIGAYERAGNCPPPPEPPAEPPTQPQPPTGDTDPPETRITKRPKNAIESDTVLFKFGSDEPGSSFKCKLDRKPFRACKSPKRYRNLDPGKHVFRVKATDASGNTDSTAARDTFRVIAE